MSNPVERIKRFIDARTGMRGLDHDIVHGINTKGEQENLTLHDLRALLADLEMAEKALRDAAISLETISILAGKELYPNGDPTCMGTFPELRGYAASRSGVAGAALAQMAGGW